MTESRLPHVESLTRHVDEILAAITETLAAYDAFRADSAALVTRPADERRDATVLA
jgi:hypothetical protein